LNQRQGATHDENGVVWQYCANDWQGLADWQASHQGECMDLERSMEHKPDVIGLAGYNAIARGI
jgi:hypothetical protein